MPADPAHFNPSGLPAGKPVETSNMANTDLMSRTGRLSAILLVLCLALVGCGLSNNNGLPSPSPVIDALPTDTTSSLPDLAIDSIALVNIAPTGGECDTPGELIRLEVKIVNLGNADAGRFVVQVDDDRQIISAGLAAGEVISVQFLSQNTSPYVRVDAASQVIENDERNNMFTGLLSTPEPPVECLKTPTPVVAYQDAEVLLEGHTAKVSAVAFSPDGNLVASGSVDNTMRLWRVDQGRLLRTMQGHPFPILSLKFSPNGATLVTGSMDGQIRLWQVSNGSLAQAVQAHAGWVNSLDVSSDGRLILSGSDDFTVRLWQAATVKEIETVDEAMAQVNSVAFSPDRTFYAFAEANGNVRLRRLSGEWIFVLTSTGGVEATSVAFSPDGSLLASGYTDGTIRIWDTGDGNLTQVIKGHALATTDLAFSPDGGWLVSASEDKTLRLWKFADGVIQNIPTVIYSGHTGAVRCVDFSPRGDHFVSGSDDASVRVWSLPQAEVP